MAYADPDKQREYQRKWMNNRNRVRRSMENRSDGSLNLSGGYITWTELNKLNFDEIKTYQQCVLKSKEYVIGRKVNRMAIAALAIRACVIKRGGKHTEEERKKTITAFAKDISVHPKTLSDWIRVKVSIVDKLPKSIQTIDYTAAKLASDKFLGGKSSAEDLYHKYSDVDPGVRSALWITHMLKSAANHINNYGNTKFPSEELGIAVIAAKTIYLGLK